MGLAICIGVGILYVIDCVGLLAGNNQLSLSLSTYFLFRFHSPYQSGSSNIVIVSSSNSIMTMELLSSEWEYSRHLGLLVQLVQNLIKL